ncbi:MAG: hypothetical protein AB1439_12120 [candidate division FCPU426 bacterium]
MQVNPFFIRGHKYGHAAFYLLFGLLICRLQAWGAPNIDLDTAAYPKGLKEPTAEETAWWNQKAVVRTEVPVTALGLSRMQAAGRLPSALQPSAGTFQPLAMTPQAFPSDLQEGNLPPEVDNSLLDAFPPIRSQVGGSCQSWCTTYYQMTYMTALVKGWNAKTGTDDYRFSPRWTYNFINGGADNGASMYAAVRLETCNGAARWSDFYAGVTPVFTAWPLDAAVYQRAAGSRISAFGSVSQLGTAEGLAKLKAYLNNGSILFFGTFISSWAGTTVSDDPSLAEDAAWVGERACHYMQNTNLGSHCMTCVGYNDTLWIDVNGNGQVDAGEKGALKIANSWGTGWNNRGFIWLAYDALRQVSAVPGAPTNRSAAFSSASWIEVSDDNAPRLLGSITLRAVHRDQVWLDFLRTSTQAQEPFPSPEEQWGGYIFYSGAFSAGSFGFDGLDYTSNPADAPAVTFVFDLTEIAPADLEPHRYVARVRNQTSPGIDVSSFTLSGGADQAVLGACAAMPQSAAAMDTVYAFADAPTRAAWLRRADDLTQVRVFPNPWRGDRHAALPVYFNHLPAGSTVRIYTSSGRLCRTLFAGSGYAGWDRREEAGTEAGRGVYFYSVQDTSGNHREGKFAIIR